MLKRRKPIARSRRRGFRFEPLEDRRLLATLGLDIRFLADDQGTPGAEIQGSILRGEPFWVDVRAQDVRAGTSQGVIALPLNLSWDPTLFQFVGDTNLTPQGNNSLPIDDPLVTGRFPLQRAVDSFNAAAGAFDPSADPNTLLDFFNLRGVSGAALPNAGTGQAIGAGVAETFSQLRFIAVANGSNAPFTVNLDGSMSFADADPLDAVTAVGNAENVAALANTVAATLEIAGGSISGTKFDDVDGDGIRDAGEPGVAGVTIQLTPTNPAGPVQEMVTLNDGGFLFEDLAAGTFTVREVIPSGSLLTFPAINNYDVTLQQENATASDLDFGNFATVTLSGIKFNDANGDGVRDAGEVGQAGVTIRLDINNDGDTSNDPLPQVTDTSGAYSFTGIAPGTHSISEVVPIGFRQTLPINGGYTITTVSGQDQTDLDFGNTSTLTISGLKFDDTDGDGVRDAGEPGRGGVTIRLDLNNDGVFDQDTVTAADGSFQFGQVPAGTHAVSEVLPTGSVRTTPSTDSIVVTVDQDNSVAGLLFGNFQQTSLSGLKFNDLDEDGIQDANELPTSGVTIELDLGNDGSIDQSVVTGTDGRYQFDNVGPGTHSIGEVVPSGFRQTLPTEARYVIENVSGSSRSDLNFGNALITNVASLISGSVYSDVNRDGVFDAGEFGLPGVTVQLFLDGASTPLQTTTTAADGGYQFTGLAAGTYRVVEIQPTRFIDASITRGTVLPSGETRGSVDGLNAFNTITLNDQETAIDYNFGEVLGAVSKRMFLSSTNPRLELCGNIGAACRSIVGTSGDDQIIVEHLADSRLRVTVNSNAAIELTAEEASVVLVDGLAGQDSVIVLGNEQNETIRSTPSQVAVSTTTQMLGVFNVPQVRIEGGGGTDTVILRDSIGADVLTASGNSAVLNSTNEQRIEVIDVDFVEAISAVDAGMDQATINAIDFVLRLRGDWQ